LLATSVPYQTLPVFWKSLKIMGERFRIRSQAAVTPHTMHFFLHKICLRFPRHGRDHLLDSCLQRYQLHPFFRITDCNPSLSRLRSATRFRTRRGVRRLRFPQACLVTGQIPRLCIPSTRFQSRGLEYRQLDAYCATVSRHHLPLLISRGRRRNTGVQPNICATCIRWSLWLGN
jgi:hypothetical protein